MSSSRSWKNFSRQVAKKEAATGTPLAASGPQASACRSGSFFSQESKSAMKQDGVWVEGTKSWASVLLQKPHSHIWFSSDKVKSKLLSNTILVRSFGSLWLPLSSGRRPQTTLTQPELPSLEFMKPLDVRVSIISKLESEGRSCTRDVLGASIFVE